MGTDRRDSQIRYLVHFDDGGSGMRYRREALEVGVEGTDGGRRYRVRRVEPVGCVNWTRLEIVVQVGPATDYLSAARHLAPYRKGKEPGSGPRRQTVGPPSASAARSI
jgi:hypothetical protein